MRKLKDIVMNGCTAALTAVLLVIAVPMMLMQFVLTIIESMRLRI